MGKKTMWEREKLLVTSNFSFSHSVFKGLVMQTRKNQGLFGKGLNMLTVQKPNMQSDLDLCRPKNPLFLPMIQEGSLMTGLDAVTYQGYHIWLATRKKGTFGHLRKLLSQISLHSPRRLIRDDSLRLH